MVPARPVPSPLVTATESSKPVISVIASPGAGRPGLKAERNTPDSTACSVRNRLMAGLIAPTAGTVRVDGLDPARNRRALLTGEVGSVTPVFGSPLPEKFNFSSDIPRPGQRRPDRSGRQCRHQP